MARMLISYYTRTRHTQHMAEVIAQGARGVLGDAVDLKPINEVAPKDLLNYDAIILGSPTYYGSMAGELKKFIDETVAFHGKLTGRVGGAFTSAANIGGGNETTIHDILNALMIHGMIVRGTHIGDHYGPVAIGDVDDRANKNCLSYGKMLAELTLKLRA
jgi:NAD(P)H dehydrogenase (quinone)